MNESIRSRPKTGVQPLDMTMVKPGSSEVLTRVRSGDWTKKKHIPATAIRDLQSFPVICQTMDVDIDVVFHQALVAITTERTTMTADKYLFFRQICSRRPESIRIAEWIERVWDLEGGMAQEIGGDAGVNIVQMLHTEIKHRLMIVSGFDLAIAGFFDFCLDGLLQPINSAKLMMQTRACEHVILTEKMIAWANEMPTTQRQSRCETENLQPWAPITPTEYSRAETKVRRQQRLYFPSLTSLSVQVMIDA